MSQVMLYTKCSKCKTFMLYSKLVSLLPLHLYMVLFLSVYKNVVKNKIFIIEYLNTLNYLFVCVTYSFTVSFNYL